MSHGQLTPSGIEGSFDQARNKWTIEKLSIDPQIKSAQSRYQEQKIWIKNLSTYKFPALYILHEEDIEVEITGIQGKFLT